MVDPPSDDLTFRNIAAVWSNYREAGVLQEKLIARVAELDEILNRANLEHFSIPNDNASITDVARQMLMRAKWL